MDLDNVRLSELRRQAEDPLCEALTTTDFATLMKTGLNTLALRGYTEEPVDWEPTVKQVTSNKKTEEYPLISSFMDSGSGPWYQEEGGEFGRVSMTSDVVRITNRTKGFHIEVTDDLIEYDQTGTIRGIATEGGAVLRRWEDQVVAKFYNDGDSTACYDAQPTFDASGGHPNLTGGAASTNNINAATLGAPSEANLEAIFRQIKLWQDIGGNKTTVRMRAIVYAPDLHWEVMRLLSSSVQLGASNASPNVWKGALQPIMFHRLDAGEWYILTDIDGLIWQWKDKPKTMKEVAGTGMHFTNLIHRWLFYERSGLGCVNWRFGFKGD